MITAVRIIEVIICIAAFTGVAAGLSQVFKKKNQHRPYGIYEKLLKRPIDAFLSTGALIVLCPMIVCLSIIVRIKLGSPVVFCQMRPGLNEVPFIVTKILTSKTDKTESLIAA